MVVGAGATVVVAPPPPVLDGLAVGAPGTTVGTVLGWLAVFHVAVVGHGVAATAGTAVP